jgi:RNA polymerase sigma-70 factor (ECF subfamily)
VIRRPVPGHPTGVEPQSARSVDLPLGVPAPPVGAVVHRAASAAGPPRSAAADARLRGMVGAHFDFVWRSLRRLGVPAADVDDCAQQVFWVAARKLDEVQVASERAFLFTTAWRVASDARRARVRRREVNEDDAAEAPAEGPDPEQIADRRRARAVLDEVLDAMPMDLRAPFVLFELEELPTAEIAAMLDLPTGTVASRLRRAREEFQSIVARLKARGAIGGGKP